MEANANGSAENGQPTSAKRGDHTIIWSALISALSAIAIAWITATYAGAEAGESAGAEAGETRVDELSSIPAGTVSFFNLADCPRGWRAKPNAVGRYLVGLDPAHEGSLNQGQGEPLSNLENRAVGNHTHPDRSFSVGGQSTARGESIAWGGVGAAERRSLSLPGLPPESPGELRNNVEGTTAPYLQLLVCEKEA